MDSGAISYRRFLEGDDRSLADLIEEYRMPLQFFLFSVAGNRDIAEEATIETFVKLATKKPKYKGKASFKTWLFIIGRNTAVDMLRKHKKNKLLSLEDAGIYVTDMDDSPEDLYIKEECNHQLTASMKKLKKEYYEVLWLKYFENLNVKEIACIMHKSENNTKVLLNRAREALKVQLGKDGFDCEDK
ncbi:MAG: RNA polymerase sigma factor [Clostridiales bacterium]|nr:RNA polymerase sigma factor [Clostridiales bacterium]